MCTGDVCVRAVFVCMRVCVCVCVCEWLVCMCARWVCQHGGIGCVCKVCLFVLVVYVCARGVCVVHVECVNVLYVCVFVCLCVCVCVCVCECVCMHDVDI